MFYDTAAITALEGRVGWAQAVPPSTIVISMNNGLSASGLKFKTFHKLATVENVKETLGTLALNDTVLQAQLDELRKQAVIKVLQAIYDQNPLANGQRNGYFGQYVDMSTTDYSNVIITRSNVFDQAIGYQMAYDVIQMMISTSRSNLTERAVTGAYEVLQIELEGVNQSNSNIATKGIEYRLKNAIDQAIAILFPQRKRGIVNATHQW